MCLYKMDSVVRRVCKTSVIRINSNWLITVASTLLKFRLNFRNTYSISTNKKSKWKFLFEKRINFDLILPRRINSNLKRIVWAWIWKLWLHILQHFCGGCPYGVSRRHLVLPSCTVMWSTTWWRAPTYIWSVVGCVGGNGRKRKTHGIRRGWWDGVEWTISWGWVWVSRILTCFF